MGLGISTDRDELKGALIEGYELTKDEVMVLKDLPLEVLTAVAGEIRKHFCGDIFDFCAIINGKSGACSEDCKYCAQSAHYGTCVEVYPLLKEEVILEDAKGYEAQGVLRYSVVTSGKRISKSDLEALCKAYEAVGSQTNLKLCASHGLLDEEDFKKLKASGVVRYHNNLETSRKYFSKICTTHTYEDKIATIKAAQKVGLEVCSGGLFGLGEGLEDRIDMAFELKALGIKSIPINILIPIKGTPLGDTPRLSEEEVLRTIALYRLIHKDATIRLAGGRNALTKAGKKAFLSGVNASITGDLLTTCGNTVDDDKKLVADCGYEVGLR